MQVDGWIGVVSVQQQSTPIVVLSEDSTVGLASIFCAKLHEEFVRHTNAVKYVGDDTILTLQFGMPSSTREYISLSSQVCKFWPA